MRPVLSRLALAALLGAAVINIGAGLRRPLIERARLSVGYYPAADAAAAAIEHLVPPGASLAIVGYDGDTAEHLDIEVWLDYRTKWLLYPRHFEEYRLDAAGRLTRRVSYKPQEPNYVATSGLPSGGYALFFRVSQPPRLPALPGNPVVLASAPMYQLVRLP